MKKGRKVKNSCAPGKKMVCHCRGSRKVNASSKRQARLAYQAAKSVAGGRKNLGVKNFGEYYSQFKTMPPM